MSGKTFGDIWRRLRKHVNHMHKTCQQQMEITTKCIHKMFSIRNMNMVGTRIDGSMGHEPIGP